MPDLKPILFERKHLVKNWGGRALERVLGLQLEPGNIGETWELFDRRDGSSRIRGSTDTLHDLMRREQRALLGRHVAPGFEGRFPLLLKFIDARGSLSVQVHPDDAQAVAERDSGKNEAWIVLDAGAEARIVRGFLPGVTREQFTAAVGTAAVESLLWSFVPRVGDCIHVPAGTLHAIGPDVVVFEVQQNSDVTYRVWDGGSDRQLHIAQALAVTRVAEGDRPTVPARPLPDGGLLQLQEPHFRVRRYDLQQRFTLPTGGVFAAITVIAGQGMLGWHSRGEDAPVHLRTGDTALVPACIEQVFLSPIGKFHLLVSDPGVV